MIFLIKWCWLIGVVVVLFVLFVFVDMLVFDGVFCMM